jgi:hypothetical protein
MRHRPRAVILATVALLLPVTLTACGEKTSRDDEAVLNGAWRTQCNPRQKVKFSDGRHGVADDASGGAGYDAVIRQDLAHADLNDDGLTDVVVVMTCVPRGQDAISGRSSVEAFLGRRDKSPQQLGEPLLMPAASCSEVIEQLESEDASVKASVRLASEDGCDQPPGEERTVELTMRKGEAVRVDPLSANFSHCEGTEGLAAAGNLVLYTRPHDDSLLAQFPRDAQVFATDTTSEQLDVTTQQSPDVKAQPGWRLAEVRDDRDFLGCAWLPPS